MYTRIRDRACKVCVCVCVCVVHLDRSGKRERKFNDLWSVGENQDQLELAASRPLALSIDQVKKKILWKHGLVSRVTKVRRGEMEG